MDNDDSSDSSNAWVKIKCAFGLLKTRFRCLDRKSTGALQFEPHTVCRLTLALCVLHNFAIRRNIGLPDGEQVYVNPEEIDVVNQDNPEDGVNERDAIIKSTVCLERD